MELLVKAGLAVAAGGLSFFAPCVLPLIPVYLGFLTGTRLEGGAPPGRAATLRQALAFVAGFSLIFVVFGAAASALGRVLFDALPWVRRAGGLLLIVLGLQLTGLLRLPWLEREGRFGLKPGRRAGGGTAFVVGIVFAAGWSPCVGPVLAGILALVADEGSLPRGILLMACYAAGLGIPFVACALMVERATAAIRRFGARVQTVSRVSGVFVAALGILLLLDAVGRLSRYLDFWTPPL